MWAVAEWKNMAHASSCMSLFLCHCHQGLVHSHYTKPPLCLSLFSCIYCCQCRELPVSWSSSILLRLKWNTLFEFLNQNPLPLGVCHLPTGSRLVLHVRRYVMVIPRSGEQSHQVWVRHWSTEAVENRDFNCGLQRTQKRNLQDWIIPVSEILI